jgi:phosphatidylinositol alpha-1,6-mannosyltransferase
VRIGYITTRLVDTDGWGKYSLEIIKEMARRGEKPVVLTSKKSPACQLPGVEQHSILPDLATPSGTAWLRTIPQAIGLRKYLADCAILHCLAEPYAILTALACQARPYILSAVGTYSITPLTVPLQSHLHRIVLRKAARITCISRFTQSRLLEKIALAQTVVVPLGVDYHKFHDHPHDDRAGDGSTLLGVGEVKRRKGYEVAIAALAKIRRQIPLARYYIVGQVDTNSNYFHELQQLIARHGLEEAVFFLGQVPFAELVGWYHRSDLFIMTPVNRQDAFEGFGLVYLEANACGVPVIGSSGCGAEDAISDGFSGFLAAQGDADAVAAAALHILLDPSLAQTMRRNALEQAQKMSWSNTVDKLCELYQEVANIKSPI